MGFLDRLLGRRTDPQTASPARSGTRQPSGRPTDERTIERYWYLLRTAPPEAIEQAHVEAFAQLTPGHRRLVLEQLCAAVPPHERVAADDPRSLARMATRAELHQPGTLERTFGGMSVPPMRVLTHAPSNREPQDGGTGRGARTGNGNADGRGVRDAAVHRE